MAEIIAKYALALQEHLKTPTSTQKYPLGTEVIVNDTTLYAQKRYKYVKATHAALTAYLPYQLYQTYTTGAEWGTRVPIPTINQLVGIPQVAFTSNYYGFVQIEGKGYAVGSSGFAAGDKLGLITSAAALSLATTGVFYAEAGTVATCVASTTVATQYVLMLGARAVCS
jgi:hypothetical protein